MDFQHIFWAGTDWDENRRSFMHTHSQIITNTIRPPAALSNLETIIYQEIPPYTTPIA